MSGGQLLAWAICGGVILAVGAVARITFSLRDIADFEPADVCDAEQLRGSDEEQPLRDVHPQLLGSLSVGGQVNNLDHEERSA